MGGRYFISMSVLEQKSEEMTRQMENIWREHNDPVFQERKKREAKKAEEKNNKRVDLGL